MGFLQMATAAMLACAVVAHDARADEWGDRIERHLLGARQRALDACKERSIELPGDFLAWIDGDPVVRASVYGCRADPLPVLLGLRSLEIDLGADTVRRTHTQLAIAFAIQDSYVARGPAGTTWNDADGADSPERLPDVRPRARLELSIPGDPRMAIDVRDPSRAQDRDCAIVRFLEDHAQITVEESFEEPAPLEYDERGVAKKRGKPVKGTRKVTRPLRAADVIASAELQREFNAWMAARGHADVSIDCGDGAVAWNSTEAVDDGALRARIAAAHGLFRTAYERTGRLPTARDAAPTAAESMAWFIRNDAWPFTPEERAARAWPRFPLDAPWPVLMMLAADDQPLREREGLWRKFVETGEARTYGEYIGGIAQQFDMQSARRLAPFPFQYGSVQMMWKDGGVCGTMGNIGARTWRVLGVPASTAGQPGHCALVRMTHDPKSGAYGCVGEQYATGGDEVTTVHAGWNYDDRGGRRPMVFHQSVAWGVDAGFAAFVDTLVMRRAWDAMPDAERARECEAFLAAGLARNPYCMAVVEAAFAASPDEATSGRMLAAFDAVAAGRDGGRELWIQTVRGMAMRPSEAARPGPSGKPQPRRRK
jgi:hypothetical protein